MAKRPAAPKPKILLLDIETLPMTILAWTTYEANALSVMDHSKVCSWSAKWLGGKQVTRALPDAKGDEKALIKELWALLDEADIVVAHNGDGFDLPKLNSRFAFFRLGPYAPVKTVDTLKITRRLFGFPSNKLDDLCQYLKLGKKVRTGGFELWQRCMANEAAAWKRMKKYNAADVVLLEGLYKHLLPWINNHPNVTGHGQCPKCGSTRLQFRGLARTSTRSYRRMQCQGCGGWAREASDGWKASDTVSA